MPLLRVTDCDWRYDRFLAQNNSTRPETHHGLTQSRLSQQLTDIVIVGRFVGTVTRALVI